MPVPGAGAGRAACSQGCRNPGQGRAGREPWDWFLQLGEDGAAGFAETTESGRAQGCRGAMASSGLGWPLPVSPVGILQRWSHLL